MATDGRDNLTFSFSEEFIYFFYSKLKYHKKVQQNCTMSWHAVSMYGSKRVFINWKYFSKEEIVCFMKHFEQEQNFLQQKQNFKIIFVRISKTLFLNYWNSNTLFSLYFHAERYIKKDKRNYVTIILILIVPSPLTNNCVENCSACNIL